MSSPPAAEPRRARQRPPLRWGRCIDHRGVEVETFIREFFADPQRRIVVLGGAGFDPRSLAITELLVSVAGDRVRGIYFRENRPHPNPEHVTAAESHVRRLEQIVRHPRVIPLDVFESDGAVTIGRNIINAVRALEYTEYTDIVVDFSALSIGASFPLTRYLLGRLDADGSANLHAMVAAKPTTDDRIVPAPSAFVGPIHGFQGRLDLEETAQAARLWMPQLRFGQAGVLDKVYEYLRPDDVVPVLPFPCDDPRTGDRLIEHYGSQFESGWSVDSRSIVYADERSPLDFYRTVLRIDDGRAPVFEETGGSLLLLSPVGSKVLSIGAMMAAIERDLPVVYVEALSYATTLDSQTSTVSSPDFVHVWLAGREVYPVDTTTHTEEGSQR